MQQYLSMMRYVRDNGARKDDRTGTGTRSVFGYQMRFDLSHGFPVITTKKLHLRSIIHELLWFLRGETNLAYLHDHGVGIWDQWADEQGELGPVYGAQWRSWPTADGRHIDQIQQVIRGIREDPDSRRHMVTAWNPGEIERMALPPCHLLYQFYVAQGKLSAQLMIRSSDSFLGLPYNTASLALLTMMLAQQCDLGLGDIIICTGDSHIYSNHFEQVRQQLGRQPRPLPRLKIRRKPASIYDYCFEDFELLDYSPHAHIAARVAI